MLAVEQAGQARDYHLHRGDSRAGARAQAIAGESLQFWGHLAEARDQLTAAVNVLRENPDTDTVDALGELAVVEVLPSGPEADQLSAEALLLGQELGVRPSQLSGLFLTRGIYLAIAERRAESIAFLRESTRLATKVGDNSLLGRALLNLADVLTVTDAKAAHEAARAAVEHLRRTGARDYLAWATGNLVQALLALGTGTRPRTSSVERWTRTTCPTSCSAIMAGWRRCRAMRPPRRPSWRDYGICKPARYPQDQALVLIVQAFTVAARLQPERALRKAQAILGHASALGVSHECIRWGWPLAARAAQELGDTAAIRALLSVLDAHPPGYLAPMLRAERDLVRARLADGDGDQAAAAYTAAISGLREMSTPYHLAHGLLDHAQYLTGRAEPPPEGDSDAADQAIAEARLIAERLGCQPLLDRADGIAPARPRSRA